MERALWEEVFDFDNAQGILEIAGMGGLHSSSERKKSERRALLKWLVADEGPRREFIINLLRFQHAVNDFNVLYGIAGNLGQAVSAWDSAIFDVVFLGKKDVAPPRRNPEVFEESREFLAKLYGGPWLGYSVDEVGTFALKGFRGDGPGKIGRQLTPIIFGKEWFEATPFIPRDWLPKRGQDRRGQRIENIVAFLDRELKSDRIPPEDEIRRYLRNTRVKNLKGASEDAARGSAWLVGEMSGRQQGRRKRTLTADDYDRHHERWDLCVKRFHEIMQATVAVRHLALRLHHTLETQKENAFPKEVPNDIIEVHLHSVLERAAGPESPVPDWVARVARDCGRRMNTLGRANYFMLVTTLASPPWTWSHMQRPGNEKEGLSFVPLGAFTPSSIFRASHGLELVSGEARSYPDEAILVAFFTQCLERVRACDKNRESWGYVKKEAMGPDPLAEMEGYGASNPTWPLETNYRSCAYLERNARTVLSEMVAVLEPIVKEFFSEKPEPQEALSRLRTAAQGIPEPANRTAKDRRGGRGGRRPT